MIDYPTNFPQPSVTLSGAAEMPTTRTSLDNGLVEQFGRFGTGRETYNLQWTLSNEELVVFEEWFSETLLGGVLVFGLLLPEDGAYELQPVRFINGQYSSSHKSALWWTVTARVEKMLVTVAPTNRTLPVPQWMRLEVDPTISQVLTMAHRNARLVMRPTTGNTTTLRIYPATDPTQYIYFGVDNEGAGETLITSQDVDPIPDEPVPSWPALPEVNQAFRLDAKANVSRLEMDSGTTRQFIAGDLVDKSYGVEWDFTLAELQTFQDFFYVTLKGGSLPFLLTLPVDGQFIPVKVRFREGRYNASYIFNDTFRVSGEVERIVTQTETPAEAPPYPMYYSPSVTVTANRKIVSGDAGKMFVVMTSPGQTINLHIGPLTIEFGVLVIGTGNVLITRTPYFVGLFDGDTGTGEFMKPGFEMRTVELNLGTYNDTGTSEFIKPSFTLQNTIRPITVPGDTGTSEFFKPSLELLTVLEPLDGQSDTGTGEFFKPSFTLDTP